MSRDNNAADHGTNSEVPPPGLLVWMDQVQEEIVSALPNRVSASLSVRLQGTLLAECFGHFAGVRLLLEDRLVSQAMILNRSLVETTTLLVYMAMDPSRADEFALRYWWQSTNRELELVREAERIHDSDLQERKEALLSDLSNIDAEAERLNIADHRKRLPSTGDMARAISPSGRAMSHAIDILSLHVHSGRSPLSRRLVEAKDTAGSFTPRESKTEWHIDAGVIATVAMTDAALAVAAIQAWESTDDIRRLADETGLGWPQDSEDLA